MLKLPTMNQWRTHIIRILCWGLVTFSIPVYASHEGIRRYSHTSFEPFSDQNEAIDIDINHYYQAGNLLDALRLQFNLPLEEDNPRVQAKMKWYYEHPDYLVQTMKRAVPWLYFISEQAKKRHLPAELVLLPVIESAYNPFAYNRTSGAAGIWQMMPETASGYGIRQNWWYDGRLDIISSTTAALDHLAYLHNVFSGDWLLALAAYDAGEGTLLTAIRKNRSEGKKTDFWSLPLPRETQNYVPQLLALAAIIAHPEFYPSNLPVIPNAPYLAEVKTGSQLELRLAASLANMSLQKLRKLNPGYSQPVTDPEGPFRLILPIEKVAAFTDNLHHLSGYPKTQWIKYKIKAGESLEDIARKFHTSAGMLRRKNPALSGIPKPGDHILVADTAPLPGENHPDILMAPTKKYSLQPGDTLYMARQGDTPDKIAKHFHVTPDKIISLDRRQSGPLYIGEKLVILTHTATPDRPQADTFYTVQANESLEEIAEKFHTTPTAIRLVNLLMDSSVKSGDQLVIPSIG